MLLRDSIFKSRDDYIEWVSIPDASKMGVKNVIHQNVWINMIVRL